MITVFDIETTFQVDKDGDKDASPKNPLNRIVSIGINDEYFFLYHTEPFEKDPNVKQKIQDILDKTTLLVAHNIKFDLMWLKEAGFTYEGKIYDTMLAEYILARHFPRGFSLKEGKWITIGLAKYCYYGSRNDFKEYIGNRLRINLNLFG